MRVNKNLDLNWQKIMKVVALFGITASFIRLF